MRGLDEPEGPQITELATLAGLTYVSVPDGVELPEQFEQIVGSIQLVTVTPELRAEIIAASPHAQLINARMIERIRAEYSTDDEAYLNRITVGMIAGLYTMQPGEMEEVQAFGAFVEGVRQWGRDQRAALGL